MPERKYRIVLRSPDGDESSAELSQTQATATVDALGRMVLEGEKLSVVEHPLEGWRLKLGDNQMIELTPFTDGETG